MAADVKLTDKGFAEIIKRTHALNGKGVKVGYQVGKDSVKVEDKVVDVLDVAIWNNYGTRTAPPRPFMDQTATKNKAVVNVAMKRVAQAVQAANPRSQDSLLGELGEFYATLIKREITSGDFVPNAESTKRRKKSSKPLVDTGRVLVPAVRWEIQR